MRSFVFNEFFYFKEEKQKEKKFTYLKKHLQRITVFLREKLWCEKEMAEKKQVIKSW